MTAITISSLPSRSFKFAPIDNVTWLVFCKNTERNSSLKKEKNDEIRIGFRFRIRINGFVITFIKDIRGK